MSLLADASPASGRGHLARCSGIGAALTERGIEPRCLGIDLAEPFVQDGLDWRQLESEDETASDVVVLDSYRVEADEIEATCLVVFDDRVVAAPPQAALAIAVGGSDGSAAETLSGPRYACLRPAFWDLPRRELRPEVERVLIAMGSAGDTDALGRAVTAARKTFAAASLAVVGEVVDGAERISAPALDEELLGADVVVCAAGQTMLEAAATGTPCVAVALVANQRPQASVLVESGAVLAGGDTDEQMEAALGRCVDLERRAELSARAQEIVDGGGSRRVASLIADLAAR